MVVERVRLGLEKSRLNPELIVEICGNVESKVRSFLEREIGKKYVEDLTITIVGEVNSEGEVTFTVDVAFEAPKVLDLDYEDIVEKVVEEAFNIVELELKKHATSSSREAEESLE